MIAPDVLAGALSPWVWAIGGLLLLLIELALPGFFLIFAGTGALVVGAASFLWPMSLNAQILLFSLATGLLVPAGWPFYRGLMRAAPAQPLNSPDRLIGKIGVVEEPIQSGRGKIRLGDSVWLATGPTLPVGQSVRVASVDGTVLTVVAEP